MLRVIVDRRADTFCAVDCTRADPLETTLASAAQARDQGLLPCPACRGWQRDPLDPESSDERRVARLLDDALLARTVADRARMLGITVRELGASTMRVAGVTPARLLRQARIHAALALLEGCDAGPGSIATWTRLGSPSALARALRGYLGVDSGGSGASTARGGFDEFRDQSRDQFRKQPRAHVDRARSATRVQLFLPAQAPFGAAALADFFRVRCMPAVESVAETAGVASYCRRWTTAQGAGLATFALHDDGVAVTIEGTGSGALPVADMVARAERMFDVAAPLAEVHARLGSDPLLAAAVAATPGRRVPGCWDPFELSVRAILGQQVSVAAACTHANRLLALLDVEGPQGLFPSADRLAAADLSGLAMPGARKLAVTTLATAVADGRVDFGAEPPQVRAALLALRGIGPWTADYIAMRGLKDANAFPAGDLVVRQALAAGGPLPSEAAVRVRAQSWQPVRAYAVLHLWSTVGAGG